MKRKIRLILLAFLVMAWIVGIWLSYQSPRSVVWVTLPDKTGIWRTIPTQIGLDTTKENLEKVMEILQRGIPEKGVLPVFPESIEYYSLSIQEKDTLEINFRNGYLELPKLQRGICETAMVHTFTSFEEVEKIRVYEEGIPVFTTNWSTVFAMQKKDTYLSFEENIRQLAIEKELLYFLDEQKNKLVAVERVVQRPVYENRASILLQELMIAPEIEGLTTLLKPTMQINAVQIRNQIGYIDFNLEFLKEYTTMASDKRLFIYSIVNTLTNLDDVEYVQFLVNGENPENYNETKGLSGLFRKNLVYVKSN